MTARKRAFGVWEGEKSVGEGPPTADALVARNHTRERKEEQRKKSSTDTATYQILLVRSVNCSRRGPPTAPVEIGAFEPWILPKPTNGVVSCSTRMSRDQVVSTY